MKEQKKRHPYNTKDVSPIYSLLYMVLNLCMVGRNKLNYFSKK